MRALGWIEAGLWLSAQDGSCVTTHGKRQLDQLWVSPKLAVYLTAVRRVETEGHFPELATFDIGPRRREVIKWKVPRPLPLPAWSERSACEKIREHLQQDSVESVEALRAELECVVNPDAQFKMWSRFAERRLKMACEVVCKERCSAAHFGRARHDAPKTIAEVPPAAKAPRHGDLCIDSSTTRCRQLVNQVARLSQLRVEDARGKHLHDPEVQALWRAILLAHGFEQTFQRHVAVM
eukprot:2254379-Amphidinium_carterae.1